MSNTTYIIQENTLNSIADRIRCINGSTDQIKVSDYPKSIAKLRFWEYPPAPYDLLNLNVQDTGYIKYYVYSENGGRVTISTQDRDLSGFSDEIDSDNIRNNVMSISYEVPAGVHWFWAGYSYYPSGRFSKLCTNCTLLGASSETYVHRCTLNGTPIFVWCTTDTTSMSCGFDFNSPSYNNSGYLNADLEVLMIPFCDHVIALTSLSSSTAGYIPKKFKILVKDELVEAYRTATNWSVIADRIYGISEYPIKWE